MPKHTIAWMDKHQEATAKALSEISKEKIPPAEYLEYLRSDVFVTQIRGANFRAEAAILHKLGVIQRYAVGAGRDLRVSRGSRIQVVAAPGGCGSGPVVQSAAACRAVVRRRAGRCRACPVDGFGSRAGWSGGGRPCLAEGEL